MLEKTFYKDSYSKAIQAGPEGENTFRTFLREVEENTRWEQIPLKSIEVMSVNETLTHFDGDFDELRGFYGLKNSDEEIQDTIANGDLMITSDNGSYLVRDIALVGLKDRAMNTSEIMKHLSSSDKATMLNISWPYMKTKAGLGLVRGGKLTALHSAAAGGYVPLAQDGLFQAVQEELEERFPGRTFAGAEYSHFMTSAAWSFKKQAANIMKPYRDAWIRAGMTQMGEIDTAEPGVRFVTSDTGLVTAAVYPVVKLGFNTLLLGGRIASKHHGKATVEDFAEKLDQLYTRFDTGIRQLADLMNVTIYNPKACFARLVKGFNLPMKPSTQQYIDFEITDGDEPTCSGHTMFLAINGILQQPDASELSPMKKLEAEENISRILGIKDWTIYDQPGPIKLGKIQIG